MKILKGLVLLLAGGVVVLVVAGVVGAELTAIPLPGDAAEGVRADSSENRFCQLWFVDDDLPATWDATFAGLGADFAAAGLGELVWVAPFRATVPGTDTYADQLR